MRRRNLMIGLGVLATGSGAAALTGASLANTVSPAADFRVNVDSADLVVERGPANYDGTETLSDGSNGGGLYIDGAASNALDDVRDLAVAANSGTNDNLDFGTIIPSASIPGDSGEADLTVAFPEALKITNTTDNAIPVGITYGDTVSQDGGNTGSLDTSGVVGYSTDSTAASETATVNSPLVTETGNQTNELSFDEAAKLFQFSVQEESGGTKLISPLGSNSEGNAVQVPNNVMEIPGNSSVSVTLDIAIPSTTYGPKIKTYITNEPVSGGSFSIVDKMFVGEASSFTSFAEPTPSFTPETL